MGGHRIVRGIERPAPSIIEGLRSAGVSTVYEAAGRAGLLPSRLRPLRDGMVMAGPVVTVSLPPDDNLMVHAAVEQCEPGDVLLVVPTDPSSFAMVGELLATSLAARGVAGLVVDAGVRDVAALRDMGFAAWASTVSAAGTTKRAAGSVNIPVRCGDVVIRPGDVIVADDDGVVAIPATAARVVLEAARVRILAEDEKRAKFAAGVLGVDLYDLRPVLGQLGVVTVDDEAGVPAAGGPGA